MADSVKFRFDARNHEYIDIETGAVFPHITGMLDRAGLVDDLWFTEESSERGTCVHKLTADFDLGAMDPATCVSVHRGYLLGHVAAMKVLKPEIIAVEEPFVHPTFRYGGRLDRDLKIYGIRGTLEIKSTAAPAKSHRIQTALQAILLEAKTGIPAEDLGRWCLYLTPKGRYKLVDHNRDPFDKAKDFLEARAIIRMCCGGSVAPWGLNRSGGEDCIL